MQAAGLELGGDRRTASLRGVEPRRKGRAGHEKGWAEVPRGCRRVVGGLQETCRGAAAAARLPAGPSLLAA